ncbi:MAG: acetylglutamate kinase [Planctomycetota bacterium]
MSVIVLKLGGSGVDAAIAREPILDAIAGLAEHERLVLVHGGGEAVSRRMAALGIERRKVQGLRVTDDAAIGEVVATLAGLVNHQLVAALRAHDIDAAGLTLTGAGLRCLRRQPVGGVDLGHVGVVAPNGEGGDALALDALLGAGIVPVVSCIGADDDGAPLNVNADDAAAGVADVLGAAQLALLTDTPGVLQRDGRAIERLDRPTAEALIESRVIEGGMVPKVRAALDLSARLRSPVRIASWRDTASPWWQDPNSAGGTTLLDLPSQKPPGA